MASKKKYRYHRLTGTIHFLPGCCKAGDITRTDRKAEKL